MNGIGVAHNRNLGPVVMMAAEVGGVSAAEAGAFFKQLRQARHLRLSDVVDSTTVPNVPYLSSLEKGRYNVLRSEHFPSLARFYGLSNDEIRRLKPDAFIEARPNEADMGSEIFNIEQNKTETYVQIRLEIRSSGIRNSMPSYNQILTSVLSEMAQRALGGLVMDKMYVNGIPAGYYALWSDRQAEVGELVIVEKNGGQYPAFLLDGGFVVTDVTVDEDTTLRFQPDRIIGAVEEVRILTLPRRPLS